MGEGCVTTTWMQLNMQLFSITGDLRYFNEIEKTVYNQLLGAENPQTGCVSYYTPLMGAKPYSCKITCCLSSVPRGIALIPYLNYTKVNDMPSVLIYEPALVKDTVKDKSGSLLPFELKLDSRFPQEGQARIHIKTPKPASFAIQLRAPDWCAGFKARVGGKTYSGKSGQWVQIDRQWTGNEEIMVSFDMPLNILEGGRSYPHAVAFKIGPQVLSLDAALNPGIDSSMRVQLPPSPAKLQPLKARFPAGWKGEQAWSLKVGTGTGKVQSLTLVPFADAGQSGAKAFVWVPAAGKDNQ
jgi:DUF1680 family protein